jgi:hypothetical protein
MSKIVHQIAISDSLPKNYVAPSYESIIKNFKNYEYIFWDYKKIKNFILKNGDNQVLEAIDSVRANSFKADIAKYYIVYRLGGWYTDLNNLFVSEIGVEDYDFVVFRDVQELTNSSWAVCSGLFYSKPNNEILLNSFQSCINNVKKKYYGGHALCPTGPNLFGSEIAKNNLPENNKFLFGDLKKNIEPSKFYLNNKPVAEYKPNNLPAGDSGLPGNNSYPELWLNRALY